MISPERLRRYAFCAGSPDSILKEIAMITEEMKFKAGDEILVEGAPASHLFLMEEGEVDIRFNLGDGRDVVVDNIVAGELFSWSALLDPQELTAGGVARKDGSILAVERIGLRQLCMDNPEFGYGLMAEIARTLRSRLHGARVQLAAKN